MTISRICSVPSCGNKHWAKGFCDRHYRRFVDHGDPLGGRIENGAQRRYFETVVLAYTDRNLCLFWPFKTVRKSGACLWVDGKFHQVSRLICERLYGPAPTERHQAAHSCGKGHLACVTPFHLRWATPEENAADKILHATVAWGERHGASRLTVSQAVEIKRLAAANESYASIGRKFGVDARTVSQIVRAKRWKQLDLTGNGFAPLKAAMS